MSVRFKLDFAKGQFAKAFADTYTPMAAAATQAMRETVEDAKQRGRQSIRAGGGDLARRWPNALRTQVYPKKGVSAQPAGLVYIRSDYAGIFEEGATITGSPYLWVPLSTTPKRFGGKKIRPGLLANLITIRRPGKPPLLGIRVKATDARFGKALSESFLRRGTSSKRGRIRVVPLFVGIPKASIAKRWNIVQAVERAMDALPGRYYANLRDT